jgi:hypothetical protein
MSNWKACIPSNAKYEGAYNTFWVMNVSVSPHEAARIQVQVQYQNGALANEFINIGTDEYKEWGVDDNWIYQKVATKLALGVLADSDTPYVAAPVTIDDNRSVHNESDIQRITSLETELEEQKKKLASIISLLGKTTI